MYSGFSFKRKKGEWVLARYSTVSANMVSNLVVNLEVTWKLKAYALLS